MLSWSTIIYGAALSVVLAVLLVGLGARERRPAVLASVAVAAVAGPVAWNAILRATHANQFLTDAPVPVFPISWQDTGSGVFTLAAASLILGLGCLRTTQARRATVLAGLAALGALLVDIYLY